MNITREKLFDKAQTVQRIRYIIDRYCNDLKMFALKKNDIIIPLHKVTILHFFDFIKNIPYRRDQKPKELIIRPLYMLLNRAIGIDCKKKLFFAVVTVNAMV